MSVTTTVKEKTTPNFSPSFFLIGPKPHFPLFAPRLEERTPTPDHQKCPLKARRPLSTLSSLLLRVLASLDFRQRRALQPRPAQPPRPSTHAAIPSPPPSPTGSGWEKTPEATGVHACTKVSSPLKIPAPFPSPWKSLPTWTRWRRISPASWTCWESFSTQNARLALQQSNCLLCCKIVSPQERTRLAP